VSGVSRFLCALIVVLALFAVSTRSRWFGSRGLDVWSLPDSFMRMQHEAERRADLNAQRARYERLQRARQQLIGELVVGRHNLVDVARALPDLCAVSPEVFWQAVDFEGKGDSRGERLCRFAIHLAYTHLDVDQPEEARRVAARLEAELQEHLARHGTVELVGDRKQSGEKGVSALPATAAHD
jgi:hypothetical protein